MGDAVSAAEPGGRVFGSKEFPGLPVDVRAESGQLIALGAIPAPRVKHNRIRDIGLKFGQAPVDSAHRPPFDVISRGPDLRRSRVSHAMSPRVRLKLVSFFQHRLIEVRASLLISASPSTYLAKMTPEVTRKLDNDTRALAADVGSHREWHLATNVTCAFLICLRRWCAGLSQNRCIS